MIKRDKDAEAFLDACIQMLKYSNSILRVLDLKLYRSRQRHLSFLVEGLEEEVGKMRSLLEKNIKKTKKGEKV